MLKMGYYEGRGRMIGSALLRRRKVRLLLGLGFVAALLVAVGGNWSATAAHASGTAKPTIGFANPDASIPSQQAVTYGARVAATHMGLKLKVADANLSPDKQLSDLNTFVAEKVKGILTWTLDPGAADVGYKAARTAGIPVVGYTSTSKYINTDVSYQSVATCAAMKDAAKLIAKDAPGAKVFVVAGPPTVPSIVFSVNCFVAAAKAAGLNVVGNQANSQNTPAAAQQLVSTELTQYPDLGAIWAFNDTSGEGAAAALKAASKTVWDGSQKGIVLIGNDGDAAAVAAIKAGDYTATYDANIALGGAMGAFVLARNILNHIPFPHTVKIPYSRIDSSNAATFVNPIARKLKFKGSCIIAGAVKACAGK